MPRKTLLFLGLLFAFCLVQGQAIDNLASSRMIDADKYIRFHYENDYFTATDYYYTQGMNLEIVSPSFKNFPLAKLLVAPTNGVNKFGISIEHNGYTPTSIESNEILYGDRPFAAALMLKTFSMSNNAERHYRMTSALTLGVIGPAAGGYEMQKKIHEWIKGTVPLGWQYQVQNDVVINYEFGIEKGMVRSGNNFLITGFATARAGTLNTKLSSGAVIMLGRLNSAITGVFGEPTLVSNRKLRFHVYVQPMINIVGYDATMQGGVFNKSSPYTLSASEVSHLTFQGNYGAVLSTGGVYLEYFTSIISKEFEMGLEHKWGGVRIGVKL